MCSALVPPVAMFATFVDRRIKDKLCCHKQFLIESCHVGAHTVMTNARAMRSV